MERHEARQARVIPIILKPVDWRNAPFAKLQALPWHLQGYIALWRTIIASKTTTFWLNASKDCKVLLQS